MIRAADQPIAHSVMALMSDGKERTLDDVRNGVKAAPDDAEAVLKWLTRHGLLKADKIVIGRWGYPTWRKA